MFLQYFFKVSQVELSVVITSKNPFVIFKDQFVENSSLTCLDKNNWQWDTKHSNHIRQHCCSLARIFYEILHFSWIYVPICCVLFTFLFQVSFFCIFTSRMYSFLLNADVWGKEDFLYMYYLSQTKISIKLWKFDILHHH